MLTWIGLCNTWDGVHLWSPFNTWLFQKKQQYKLTYMLTILFLNFNSQTPITFMRRYFLIYQFIIKKLKKLICYPNKRRYYLNWNTKLTAMPKLPMLFNFRKKRRTNLYSNPARNESKLILMQRLTWCGLNTSGLQGIHGSEVSL